MKLKPYQEEAARWLADHPRGLLADEMGLGKTTELLHGAELAGRQRIVVVTPAVACPHWMHELATWYPKWMRYRIIGTKQRLGLQQDMLDGVKVLVLNYDIVKPYAIELAKWADCLIVDESHYVKNKDALRTKAIRLITRGVLARKGYVWLASGTPMPNRPFELVEQLDILGHLQTLGGWEHYVQRYCEGHRQTIYVRGGRRRSIWITDGAGNLRELRTALDKGIMLRRLRRDVMPDIQVMPPSLIPLDVARGSRFNDYLDAERNLIDFLWQKAIERALAKGLDPTAEAVAAERKALAAQHLVELSTLRRLIGECKVEGATEWIKTWLEGGHKRKLVVFAHHREVVAKLAACCSAAVLVGGMDDAARTQAIESFRAPTGVQVMVASTPATGIGINLTPCSDVVFVEYEWTAAAHRQATDRCARIGQENPVSVTYLYAPETVDERMATHIANQMTVVETVFGHEGDVAEAVLGDFLTRRKG